MIDSLDRMSLQAILAGYSNTSLQQIARKHRLEIKGQKKEDLINALTQTLADPEQIATSLSDLAPIERVVLDRLILLGGKASTRVLRGQLQAEGAVDSPTGSRFSAVNQDLRGAPSKRGSTKFEDIVARLSILGLALTVNIGPYSRNVELTSPALYIIIPDPVLQQTPEVTVPVETQHAPGIESVTSPDPLLRDVYMLLSVVQNEPIQLTVRGQIPKRTLTRIDPLLRIPEGAAEARSESDLGRLTLLRALAEGVGLIAAGPGLLLPGDCVDDYLARPRGERLRQLFDVYRASERWSELAQIPNLSVSPKGNMFGPRIVAARGRVLAEIARLPADEWIAISHLIDRLRRQAYDFLLSRDGTIDSYSYYGSYHHEPNPYGGQNSLALSFEGIYDEKRGWERVETQFIRVLVVQALYWFGITDLGMDEGTEPSSFRITPEGADLVAGTIPTLSWPEPHIVIQPNFQMLAFEPIDESTLFKLDQIARRVRAEQVVEYHLSRESVHAALRRGMDIQHIVTFLHQVSSTPLPQNVSRSLEEWGAQMERIVVQRGIALLQSIDEQTLDTLYADPEIARLLGRRVGPTAALVPQGQINAFYTAILRGDRTYPLPALSEGNDALLTASVSIDGEGNITFLQKLPSIYAVHALRAFADEQPDGRLRLTRSGLRRAARNGLTADRIIATLEQLQGSPLTDALVDLVQGWATDWGHATLVETALLQVENAETMNKLLADSQIKRFLRPISGAGTFAIVRREGLEQVRTLLEERGMELGTRL